MLSKALIVGAMALAPIAALAADRTADSEMYRSVPSVSNQGYSFTYRAPVSEQAPYALTGPQSRESYRWAAVQIGQGGYERVRVPAQQ